MIDAGYIQKDIAKKLGVSESTVSREIRRNYCKEHGFYNSMFANMQYRSRRKKCHPDKKIKHSLQDFVEDKIKRRWSPEQISGYAKLHDLFHVSHETIYHHIYDDRQCGGDLYGYLRRRGRKYKSKLSRFKYQNSKPSIHSRPDIVNDRIRIGDWELDTIVSSNYAGPVITTITDRVSKILITRKVPGKSSTDINKPIVKALKPINKYILTLTSDNGTEFSGYKYIAQSLDTNYYFADPYCSWQRGTNENTNGLLRQYIPKKNSFDTITEQELSTIENEINNRPRKTLGYLTPLEFFKQHTGVDLYAQF